MARCCSVAPAGIPGVAKMFFSLSFIVYWSLQMYVKISGNMCILPRMIVENTLYRAFRLIIAPNRPRSVWQNGCSYHFFVGSGVQHGLGCRCPAMVAMPAVPCPEPVFSREWLCWRAVRQTAAVLSFLSNRFIVSPGCATVWLSVGCGLGRFEWQNGAFCCPKRALLRPR